MNTPSGTLIISSLNAQLIRNTEKIGKMDPYVNVAIGRNVQSTQVCHKGHLTPSWPTEIGFRFRGDAPIFFEVWDNNHARKNDFIGAGALWIPNLKDYSRDSVTINLYCDGLDAGQLFVNYDFYPDGGRLDQSNLPQSTVIEQTPLSQSRVLTEPSQSQVLQRSTLVKTTFIGERVVPLQPQVEGRSQSSQGPVQGMVQGPVQGLTPGQFPVQGQVPGRVDQRNQPGVEQMPRSSQNLPSEGEVPEWVKNRPRTGNQYSGGPTVGMRPDADLAMLDLNRGDINWKERLERERYGMRTSVDPGWSQPVNTGARPTEVPVTGVRYNP